jgi:hypothetical protein
MQGLYPREAEFAERLDWVGKNLSAGKYKTEKRGRKWRWYEMDLEEEEREVQASKKICLGFRHTDEVSEGLNDDDEDEDEDEDEDGEADQASHPMSIHEHEIFQSRPYYAGS